MSADSNRLVNVPNALTVSRVPLTILLCAFIEFRVWPAALTTFVVAAVTDMMDGWWARRFGQLSAFGRVFDPLTDKILIGGAFIFLIPVEESQMRSWMAAVVIGRELLITGVRGYVESLGKKFGADWFGKLKMALQCAVLIGVLLIKWLETRTGTGDVLAALRPVQGVLLWAMLVATVGSGVQYLVKAAKLLGRPGTPA